MKFLAMKWYKSALLEYESLLRLVYKVINSLSADKYAHFIIKSIFSFFANRMNEHIRGFIQYIIVCQYKYVLPRRKKTSPKY